MATFKQGWFARLARKYLEEQWEEQANQLGSIDRPKARDDAFDDLQESGGLTLGGLVQLLHERFNAAEQRVLKSNQRCFRLAIRGLRDEATDLQQPLPGILEDKMAKHFGPIASKCIKDPGPDQAFGELRPIGDVDFSIIYQMTQVRDEKTREVMLSTEDYAYMEEYRKALGVSENTTLEAIIHRITDTAA